MQPGDASADWWDEIPELPYEDPVTHGGEISEILPWEWLVSRMSKLAPDLSGDEVDELVESRYLDILAALDRCADAALESFLG